MINLCTIGKDVRQAHFALSEMGLMPVCLMCFLLGEDGI
jgi:hypothetical protein